MLCIDNKHLYRSAFLIPRWLCRAMDFINGSLHSVSHTERCSHYSNARELHPLWNVCTMESNMHEVRATLISAKNIHVNELDRTLLAKLSLSLSLSLQQHRGLQLSEVGDLWSFNTGKSPLLAPTSHFIGASHTLMSTGYMKAETETLGMQLDFQQQQQQKKKYILPSYRKGETSFQPDLHQKGDGV